MDIYWVEKFPQILQVASLLIVFIILAVFGQRKTWISTEIIMAAAVGTGMTLFPKYLLNFQIKSTYGNMEDLLGRFYGVTLLTSCLTWCRTRNSLDATVPLSIMLSRLFMGSILLMTQLFVIGSEMKKSSGIQFSEQFVPAFVMPTALWLLGNTLHLARSSDFNTYPRYNVRLNHHLRVDAWFQLLIGVAWIAFPGHISPLLLSEKKSTNRIIVHLGRSIGALAIGEAFTSLQAVGFLHNDDKKQLLLTRIMMSLSQCVAVLVSCAHFDTISLRLIIVLCCLTLPSLLNAVIGFLTDGTAIYQIPPPASPAKQVDSKTL